MAFLKKHLLFCLVVGLSLLACAAGVFFALQASGKVSGATSRLAAAKSQLNNLKSASPAPSEANVAASEANVANLLAELAEIRADLQRGSRVQASTDGVAVMASVQQYIADFQRAVANRVNERGEPDPIQIDDGFAFGFEQYSEEAQPLSDDAQNRKLDKQRQILAYLINQLIESDPDAIEAVRREFLERDVEARESGRNFKISPAISARVPGAVDTMAFSLTFTGYTNVLRHFLNELAKFELPIVVRSIAVERPSGSETVTVETNEDGFDALFGALGSNEASEPDGEEKEAQEPVISENISRFTVVVEFIEIVRPDDPASENLSDPA